MFDPARRGSICGWSPTDDHHDTLYSTIPPPTGPSSSTPTPSSSSSSSAPRPARNTIPRSLSLDSRVKQAADGSENISRFKNATSLRRYKVKRSKDPNWAPRPPNAFILFRRDFVEQHKGENLLSPDKTSTLSKRAGEAWGALPKADKTRYFDAAKEEADEHLRRNPGYQFRPNKQSRSESRRHPAHLTRRERVEAHIAATTRKRAVSATRRRRASQSPPPRSAASSASPEPPGTPSSHDYLEMGSQPQSRSSSISAPAEVLSSTSLPPGLDHGLYSDGSVHSTPSSMRERPLFSSLPRTVSYTEGASYSPWDYISFDKCYTESDDQSSQSFGSATPEHSPLAYFGEMSPEQLSPQHEFNAPLQGADTLYMASTNVATSADMATNASYIPPPAGPLFERRRRSATTSMIPSPMTVIASSLSAWSRDDLMTSRPIPGTYAAPPRPMLPHAGQSFHIPVQAVQPPSMQVHPADMQANDMQTQEDVWQQTMSAGPAQTNLLSVPVPEYDLDRTPRGQFFPQDAQQVAMSYAPQPPMLMVPMGDLAAYPVTLSEPSPPAPPAIMEPFDLAADLEAYNLGLRTFGIGAAHDVYAAAGFDDSLTYGQLCYPAAAAEQNA